MLVSLKTKTLILNLQNPDTVLSLIPTAKTIMYGGHRLVVVPHRYDETTVLRNIGINAPSPIEYYYDFPGRYKPFDHQKRTAAFCAMYSKCMVLNEIGTGKTLSVLWAIDYLRRVGQAHRTLIVSPLSTLERVWADAIFQSFPRASFAVLHGSAEKRRKLLKVDYDYYVINHDGIGVVYQELLNKNFDSIVVDEAAVLRNPSTKRFKLVRGLVSAKSVRRVWLLTGTPTPNEPTDAWTLHKLLHASEPTQAYHAFRDKVMMKVGMWKWAPRPEANDVVYQLLQPSVRYTRDECMDLPPTIVQTRHAELTDEQKSAYSQMVRHLHTELKTGAISAVNEAGKLLKLVQIVCGVAYDSQGNSVLLDCHPRVALTKEIIEEAGQKVIVFVPLTGTLRMLEQELAKHWTVAIVDGSVSPTKRNEIFTLFQNTKDPHVLVAHPGTMAHGLTLTEASTIIWYGPIPSNEQYVQACGRIERTGKKGTSHVIHIESTELEHRIYERLQNKQRLQGLLLDMIENQKGNYGHDYPAISNLYQRTVAAQS